VNDFRVIGGINGEDAIEPGAPPTCFGIEAFDVFVGSCCMFDADDTLRLRLLRFLFDMYSMVWYGITIIIYYYYYDRLFINHHCEIVHEMRFSVFAFPDAHPS